MKKSALLLLGVVSLVNTAVSAYPIPASVTFKTGNIPSEYTSIRAEFGFTCGGSGGMSWMDLQNKPNLSLECKGEGYVTNFWGYSSENSQNTHQLFSAGDETLIGPYMYNLIEPTKPLCSLDAVKGNSTVTLEYEPAFAKTDHSQHGYFLSCTVENQ